MSAATVMVELPLELTELVGHKMVADVMVDAGYGAMIDVLRGVDPASHANLQLPERRFVAVIEHLHRRFVTNADRLLKTYVTCSLSVNALSAKATAAAVVALRSLPSAVWVHQSDGFVAWMGYRIGVTTMIAAVDADLMRDPPDHPGWDR